MTDKACRCRRQRTRRGTKFGNSRSDLTVDHGGGRRIACNDLAKLINQTRMRQMPWRLPPRYRISCNGGWWPAAGAPPRGSVHVGGGAGLPRGLSRHQQASAGLRRPQRGGAGCFAYARNKRCCPGLSRCFSVGCSDGSPSRQPPVQMPIASPLPFR